MTGTAAIIGGGVIGGGWVARFLQNGWDVRIFDPDPEAERKIDAVLANARRAVPGLTNFPMPEEGRLTWHDTIAEAVTGADWVQESVPERLDLKQKVLAEVEAACGDAIIGSSTSGFKPSELQAGRAKPGQIVVTHPFNPVYLLPLVELVTTGENTVDLIERAKSVLAGLTMYPLHLTREIDAHVADRLLEAVWREALWLVNDGIATTEEIDEAIRMGFGLRWAQMGLFETYRIAGGEAVNFDQTQINVDRHSIECRINAEDPAHDFMPSPGRINGWYPPHGAGIRIDSHCRDGYLVPPFYDSMIGKLIVTATDRDNAIERLNVALETFEIDGVTTNLPLLRQIVDHPDFKANKISTRWLEQQVLPGFQS